MTDFLLAFFRIIFCFLLKFNLTCTVKITLTQGSFFVHMQHDLEEANLVW